MNNNQFSYHITKYFSEYLPSVKGVSNKTIQSYRGTFVIFLDYIHEVYKLNINILSIHDIDDIIIEKFLEYLENNRKNSISTRNQRLAALHSFYRYLQKRELSCYDLCSRCNWRLIRCTPSGHTGFEWRLKRCNMTYYRCNRTSLML